MDLTKSPSLAKASSTSSTSVLSADVTSKFNEATEQKEKLDKQKRELDFMAERDFQSLKADFVFDILLWLPLGLTLLIFALYFAGGTLKKKRIKGAFK